MTPEQFCYWLQGAFELSHGNVGDVGLDSLQVKIIRNHLNLVFQHSLDPKSNAQTTASPADMGATHAGGGVAPQLLRC